MPLVENHICTDCKTQFFWEKPQNGKAKGMGWGMVALGLFATPLAPLWIPGAIIAVNAHMKGKPKCPACKSKKIIPIDSPRGQELTGTPNASPSK